MKKKIPLSILEALQPIADNNLDLIKAIKDTDSMFHLIDRDENSNFHFKISKQEFRSGKLNYFVQYQPKNKDNVNANARWSELEGVKLLIKEWLELLQSYNKIHTIYDDPILKTNQERFEKQFDIIDSDADINSFDLTQQLYIDEYLNGVKSKLLSLQEGRPEEQAKELQELSSYTTEIQNNLTKETKRQIVKRLSVLWAKAQKIGLDVIKEIFVSVAAELGKRLLTG